MAHGRDHASELGALRAGLPGTALRLREHRDHSRNLRGAYLHVLSALLGSVGAVVAGVVIVATGWSAVDAVASVVIACLILFSSWALVREAVDVLMEAVPAHIDLEALRRSLERGPRPDEVHDLHFWRLTTGRDALSPPPPVAGHPPPPRAHPPPEGPASPPG